jgi:hypothetical protein
MTSNLKLLAGTYFVCDEIQRLWLDKRELDNSEGRNTPGMERRWLVYYGVGSLLRLIYKARKRDLDADIRKLYKPNDWVGSADGHAKKTLAEVFRLTSTAISKVYVQAEKQAGFRHRNWFRNSNTLTDIDAELLSITEYRSVQDLPTLRAASEDK